MQKCIEAEAMERFFVDSVSEPGVQRECILWDNGRWTCSCPWGTRNLEPDKKDCRHIQQAKRQLVERELAETLKRLRTDMEHWAVPEASMVRILGDLSREVLCGPADRARLTREREITEWLEECDAADKEKRRFQISLQRYAEKISRDMTMIIRHHSMRHSFTIERLKTANVVADASGHINISSTEGLSHDDDYS